MFKWITGNEGQSKHRHRWGPPEEKKRGQALTRFCKIPGCHGWQTKKRISRREYLAERNVKKLEVVPLNQIKIGGLYRNKQGRLIYMESGAYEIENRISNHWSWRIVRKDGTLGKRQFGYGDEWRAVPNFEVVIKVRRVMGVKA